MIRIESETVTVNRAQGACYQFLSDFNNFKIMMPDQVTDWKSTVDECSFTIKGMASLGMKISEKIPASEIKIIRNGKAPFDFMLTCCIEPSGANSSSLKLLFDADLNPMLKLMAEKPLQNFLNMLVHKFRDYHAAAAS